MTDSPAAASTVSLVVGEEELLVDRAVVTLLAEGRAAGAGPAEALDSSAARLRLGWQPPVTVDAGLKEAARHFLSQATAS